jgi:chromosome segregation ATPase
VLLSRGHA